MKITRRAFTTASLSAGGVLAFSAASAATAPAKTVAVRIDARAGRFAPASLTIKAGDTVEWTNPSSILHSVDFDPVLSKVVGNVQLPAGVAPFASGAMQEGEKFSHVFTAKGTYKYICKYHESMGMVATVIVT